MLRFIQDDQVFTSAELWEAQTAGRKSQVNRFGGMHCSGADFCSESGAKLLCDLLHMYWKKQGFDVKFQVEKASIINGAILYIVRSDLVNGLPKKDQRSSSG